MLTPEQRQSLEWMAESLTLRPLDRAAIKAALADLDSCRDALAPVAREVRRVNDLMGRYDIDRYFMALSKPEADAVLAAAGGLQQEENT